jgi:rhamnogalacturonyl hydrolase YesR
MKRPGSVRARGLAFALVMALSPIASPAWASEAAVPHGRAEILRTAETMTLAEIARMQAAETAAGGLRRFRTDASWIPAAFFVGAARVARVSQNDRIYGYLRDRGERFYYGLRGPGAPVALLNADDQAIGDLYIELYARRRLPGVLMPLRQRMDFTAPYLEKTPTPKKLVWWWSDSLFMAPPVYARMSAITGDPKYLRAMDVQWWRTYERLWDPKEHLFFRDERFITRRAASGEKIFWSRGNGWVLAGLARVLEAMPADFPSRPRYEALYRDMAARLAGLQHADGLWRTSLTDASDHPEPETSGSAFFVYGLAFGVNHGVLDRKTYLPVVERGWAGLNRHVRPDGLMGMVQRAGDQPVPTRIEDTALYASGAYLLAAMEMVELDGPPTPLPTREPPRDATVEIAHDIGPNRPASTPAEEVENARRDAERRAMIELPYDPEVDDPDYRSPVSRP